MGPETVKEEKETAIGQMCIDVFGEGWQEFRIAHLSTIDSIGIELFEFPHQSKTQGAFEPFKTGIFHFCVQDPNLEELAKKIVEAGGKQRMPVREYYPGEKPFRMVYMGKILSATPLRSIHTVISLPTPAGHINKGCIRNL